MPFRSLYLLLVFFASATPFYNVTAVGLPAYLEDADTDFTRSTLEPLGRHLFPRVAISETKALPDSAEAISKWNAVLVSAPQMHDVLKSAQRINPDLLIFRKFNAGGYVGFKEKSSCADPYGVPFGWTALATADCGFYAGHWLYYAGTLLNESIATDSRTFSVADGSRITAGRYVVIYDHPAGSFRNAEHALVSGVSGNRVTLAGRGFKSIPRAHPAGSIIAEHPVAGNVDGETETLHWMYNMSSVAPQDSNGRRIYEVMASWLGSNVQRDKTGKLSDLRIDGVIFDTDFWSVAWRNRIDVNNDLIPDGGWDSTTGTNLWGEGSEEFYRRVRVALPDLIVSGGTRGVRGFSSLNGTQLEGWPVSTAYIAPNPAYITFDGWLAEYTLQLREGRRDTPAYTENLSKTPTRLYPRGTVPAPPNNAPFRFAFATTLLDNGYYAQEPRQDTLDPWWDEFAVDVAAGSPTYGVAVARNPLDETAARIHGGWLGMPLGPRQRVVDARRFTPDRSLISSGGLDDPDSLSAWRANNVSLSVDFNEAMAGAGSIRVSNHIDYVNEPFRASAQTPLVQLQAGVRYTLAFSARAQTLRSIMVATGGAQNEFLIPDRWVRRVMTFTAPSSGPSRINFNVGRENIPIWLDEIYLFEGDANVFRRDFDNGLVVVNATPEPISVALGSRYHRIAGTGQDPINNGEELDKVTIPPYDGAIMVLDKNVAAVPPCGEPSYNSATDTELFLWQDCADSQQWRVRFTAGGQPVSFRGSVTSDAPFLSLAGVSQEPSDTLMPDPFSTATNGPISYVQNVGSTGFDGFDFRVGPNADTCFAAAAPADRPVLLGADRVAVTSPISLRTFGACTPWDVAAVPPCGEPSYDSATDTGLFLWQDCADPQQWRVRFTAGRQPVSFSGSVTSDAPFLSLAGVSQEPSDTLMPDPFSTATNGPISYEQNVGGTGFDGFDFRVGPNADTCFAAAAPADRPVLLGADRVAVTSPISLRTFGACRP